MTLDLLDNMVPMETTERRVNPASLAYPDAMDFLEIPDQQVLLADLVLTDLVVSLEIMVTEANLATTAVDPKDPPARKVRWDILDLQARKAVPDYPVQTDRWDLLVIGVLMVLLAFPVFPETLAIP